MKTYKGNIHELPENGIFVFGSNPQGRHGLGAALVAKKYFGAKYGQARGLMGKSYGIVTKDLTKSKHPSVPTKNIKRDINELYEFASVNSQLDFYIAYSGKGKLLSGFTPEQMANLWAKAHLTKIDPNLKPCIIKYIPENIIFEEEFYKLVIKHLD